MSDDKDKALTSLLKEDRQFPPSADFVRQARIGTREAYDALYKESLESPDTFWRRESKDLVFRETWTDLGNQEFPHSKWFLGARLNITESCLDRHLKTATKNKAAIIWEGEHGDTRT